MAEQKEQLNGWDVFLIVLVVVALYTLGSQFAISEKLKNQNEFLIHFTIETQNPNMPQQEKDALFEKYKAQYIK